MVQVTTVPMTLRLLEGQLDYLRRCGYDVVVISSPGPELEELGGRDGFRVFGVEMTRRITPFRDLAALVRIVRTLLRERPHIVHAHTPKAGLLGMIGGLVAAVPVRIFQMRGLPLMGEVGLRRALLRFAERTTCALAHRIVCNGPSLREVAIREGLAPPERLVIAGPGSGQGVDAEDRFNPDRLPVGTRGVIRARYGIPPEATVVGFVGRLVGDKGIGELDDAWRLIRDEHPEAYLLVVGPYEEDRDRIPPDVRKHLADDPRVRLAGENWDTPPLYAAMDIVVFPSHREGFPNVPLEASAMGIPVVVTRIPGCVDAVVEGETGLLVPPGNPQALAGALRRYLADPSLRRRHGAAGRHHVRRTFRPREIFSAIEGQYTELLSRHCDEEVRSGALKRGFDVVVAATALLVLLPVLALIAVAILLRMGRPIVFTQERTGMGGETFTIYKFRTMRDRRGPAGRLLPDGDRLTVLGRFLRRTSLDELPTLWNVLRGDMSIVGPRPLLPRYLPYYDEHQAHRHRVPPGMTGWAQVHGRNAIDWNEKFRLDVWYVDHHSLRLDMKIILTTLRKVLAREGIDQEGRATVEPFDEWVRSRQTGRTTVTPEGRVE